VPPNYDSLLAKLIAWGPTREIAIARMERALSETVIAGVPTTIPFHRLALADEGFRRGDVHTGFVGDFLDHRAGALGIEEHEISPVRA
jgi:acetyl-CoA carboxylase, biotin carboxylase subunit